MLHHLELADKAQMLREVRRVLKPGGCLELLDFVPNAQPHPLLKRLAPPNELMKDNAEHRVLTLMNESGFSDARRVGYGRMLIGRIAYYRASSPLAALRRLEKRRAHGARRSTSRSLLRRNGHAAEFTSFHPAARHTEGAPARPRALRQKRLGQ
jgi:SAM-dependent methyltransferase